MEVTLPSKITDENLDCIPVNWSTPDEMYHFVCWKKVEGGNANVGERYEVESLLSPMDSVLHV